jgi:RNase adaptor protein for sRNA GlmZ degradation
VVVAEELARRLRAENLEVTVRHRDVGKPDPR